MKNTSSFKVDYHNPTTILEDFNTFINYIESNKVELSAANGFIGRKHLYAINEMLNEPQRDANPNKDQPAYAVINLFYYISLSSSLTEVIFVRGDKKVIKVNEKRWESYKNLTCTEKYMFLLETLWCRVDWRKMQEKYFMLSNELSRVQRSMETLSNLKPGQKIENEKALDQLSLGLGYGNVYMKIFGFWDVEEDINDPIKKDIKLCFPTKSICPTEFGIVMAKLLHKERKFKEWNIPYRIYMGEYKDTLDEDDDQDLMKKKILKIIPEYSKDKISPEYDKLIRELVSKMVDEDKREQDFKNNIYETLDKTSREKFLTPFISIFEEGELKNTLPPLISRGETGIYTFKVSLYKDVWRKIEISSKCTLLDLHNTIQSAFKFDDDHLYDFSIERFGFSDTKVFSPYNDEGPFVDEVTIEDINLKLGERMVYLFDYGDNWMFEVKLEDIREVKKLPSKPKVVEAMGKAPSQYEGW